MTLPKTPLLTADTIIELVDRSSRPIVLVRRRNEPLGWALPGGFVDVGESVETAARREAAEETGLDVTLEALLGVYSDPQRDPRFHACTVVYVAHAKGHPSGGDDAASAKVFTLDSLPRPLVFDHARILKDYGRWRAAGGTAASGLAIALEA